MLGACLSGFCCCWLVGCVFCFFSALLKGAEDCEGLTLMGMPRFFSTGKS